jgi:hypothetical protein
LNPYYQDAAVTLYHGNCLEILPQLDPADHLMTDTPYSERTHKGHNQVEGVKGRRGIDYQPWAPEDVETFVKTATHKCLGWFVAMSDHVLAYAWERCLIETGRYVFPPLPFVSTGSRFRMAGDGPASWSVWINTARPKSREFCGWGSLDGAYILPLGEGKSYPIVGGKPDWICRVMVRDYSRPGDIVLDPCMGAGTFPAAAKFWGRRAIGIDKIERCCELAAIKCEGTKAQHVLPYAKTPKAKQIGLL